MTSYDYEPVRGLAGPLPKGERILWQGAPRWTSLARHLCHVRLICLYFGVLMLWQVAATAWEGRPLLEAFQVNAWLALLLAATIAMLSLFAWAVARTTVYTITTARVALRFGIAIPKIVNVPFRYIHGVALSVHPDGTGDIPLALTEGNKIAYLILWPHTRPLRFTSPEPMLRSVTQPSQVAKILGDALIAYAKAPKEQQPDAVGVVTQPEKPSSAANQVAA